MKPLKWKKRKRDDYYGNWYLLELSFDNYCGMWIREPICIPTLTTANFPLYANPHETGCPKTNKCGWVLDFSELHIGDYPLEASSLSEAKAIAKRIINDRLIRFLEILNKVE